MEKANGSVSIDTFLQKWLLDLSTVLIAARIDPFLENHELPDLKINALLHAYDLRLDFKEAFIAWTKSKQSTHAEQLSFDSSIRLVGIDASTIFLIACLLAERLPAPSLQRDPITRAFKKPIEQIFTYALKAKEKFGNGGRYQTLAFAAGLYFDYLNFNIEMNAPPAAKKKLEQFLQSRFDLALIASEVGIKLSRYRNRLEREKEFIPLVFLELASQAIFSFFNPEYADFILNCEKNLIPTAVEEYAERLRFQTHHSRFALASLLAIPSFSQLGDAVYFLCRPELIHPAKQQGLNDLVSLTHLSLAIAKGKIKPPPESDTKSAITLTPVTQKREAA